MGNIQKFVRNRQKWKRQDANGDDQQADENPRLEFVAKSMSGVRKSGIRINPFKSEAQSFVVHDRTPTPTAKQWIEQKLDRLTQDITSVKIEFSTLRNILRQRAFSSN